MFISVKLSCDLSCGKNIASYNTYNEAFYAYLLKLFEYIFVLFR